ncbi:MAG: hypothetical protein AAGA81_22725 [Acidobacteriota bacterium]
MPFRKILDELVHERDDMLGALFIDESGEIVHEVDGAGGRLDLRLVGAWVGIYLRQLDRIVGSGGLGELKVFQSGNGSHWLSACPLEDGYSLLGLQQSPSLAAESRRALIEAGDKIIEAVLR